MRLNLLKLKELLLPKGSGIYNLDRFEGDLRGKGNNSEAILWQKHSHPPSSEAHLERTASSTAGAPRLAFPNPKNPCGHSRGIKKQPWLSSPRSLGGQS